MSNPMRLVMVVVNRGKGEEVQEFNHENNIDFSYLAYGRGTLRGEMVNMLGLGTVDKDVIISLVPLHEIKTYLAGLCGLLKLKRPGKGIAFTMPLMSLNALVAQTIEHALPLEEDEQEKEVKAVTPKFSLIITIVEQGFVEQVMDAAKSAGATGGTLLHARGIGREEAETFLGASLQTEKEVVTILAERSMHREIMERINSSCGVLCEAKGVVFSLPVDEIVGIS